MEINSLDIQFYGLVLHLKKELLKHKDFHLGNLQSSVIYLPLTVKRDHYDFIKKSSEDINNADDIEDLFKHLNLYWSSFEYSLLDHIIQRHSNVCSEDLKQKMVKYKRDIEDFKKHTTVQQLWECHCLCGEYVEPPPHFSRIVTKLERKAVEYTLEEIDQFRRDFCYKLNLRTFILTLVSFIKGSLCIVWHIPSSEVHRFTLAFSSTLKTISAELCHLEVDKRQIWSRDTSDRDQGTYVYLV